MPAEELDDVIVAVGPARDGVDGLVEDVEAAYEPDLRTRIKCQ